MEVRLDGRVAIVTGAGAGLGRSHALMLASRGAKVLVNDLGSASDDPDSARRAADVVVEEIRAAGGTAVANYDSVADPAGAQALVASAVEAFGGVDILVNNAGILRDKSFGKMDMADFDEVVRVHLSGTAYVTHAVWPLMTAKKYGRVVFTLSNTGLYGNFGQANYGAGKAGLVGLMNVLRIEGAKNNILVNAVAPMAATRMTEASMSAEVLERFLPEYPSAAVAYMCSDQFTESGTIISTAAGHYSAVKIVSSEGAQLDGAASPEAVAAAWSEITDMSGARTFANAAEEVAFVMDAAKSGVVA